jgi:hypothetical protein
MHHNLLDYKYFIQGTNEMSTNITMRPKGQLEFVIIATTCIYN